MRMVFFQWLCMAGYTHMRSITQMNRKAVSSCMNRALMRHCCESSKTHEAALAHVSYITCVEYVDASRLEIVSRVPPLRMATIVSCVACGQVRGGEFRLLWHTPAADV